MHLTAASLGLLSLVLPASAEARARNATMREKIMEKLEELRQKAGLSKPKDEGEEKKPNDEPKAGLSKPKDEGEEKKSKDEVEGKSKLQNGTKETKPKSKDEKEPSTRPQHSTVPPIEGPSVPALPSIINGKTVETTLP